MRNRSGIARRLLSGVDLAIDFATLGQYGLEPAPALAGAGCEGSDPQIGWEALRTARRESCPDARRDRSAVRG